MGRLMLQAMGAVVGAVLGWLIYPLVARVVGYGPRSPWSFGADALNNFELWWVWLVCVVGGGILGGITASEFAKSRIKRSRSTTSSASSDSRTAAWTEGIFLIAVAIVGIVGWLAINSSSTQPASRQSGDTAAIQDVEPDPAPEPSPEQELEAGQDWISVSEYDYDLLNSIDRVIDIQNDLTDVFERLSWDNPATLEYISEARISLATHRDRFRDTNPPASYRAPHNLTLESWDLLDESWARLAQGLRQGNSDLLDEAQEILNESSDRSREALEAWPTPRDQQSGALPENQEPEADFDWPNREAYRLDLASTIFETSVLMEETIEAINQAPEIGDSGVIEVLTYAMEELDRHRIYFQDRRPPADFMQSQELTLEALDLLHEYWSLLVQGITNSNPDAIRAASAVYVEYEEVISRVLDATPHSGSP